MKIKPIAEQMKKKDIPEINYFGDAVTAHIFAEYRDGKFYELLTKKPVKLETDPKIPTIVKIIAPLHCLPQQDFENHAKYYDNKILDVGSQIWFDLSTKNYGSLKIKITLNSDLTARCRGNKNNRLNSCLCSVVEINHKEAFQQLEKANKLKFDSLNQCYTQISVLLRPENRTHTCNVFKTFYYEYQLLDHLRNKS